MVSTFLWCQLKNTGLLAATGSIAMYMAMMYKPEATEDYDGLDSEDREWEVRRHLRKNFYRIGYWKESEKTAVYGIRRFKLPTEEGM